MWISHSLKPKALPPAKVPIPYSRVVVTGGGMVAAETLLAGPQLPGGPVFIVSGSCGVLSQADE